jgi:hypothetical protein
MSDNDKPFPIFHFSGEDYLLLQHIGGTHYAVAGHTDLVDFETRLGLIIFASRDNADPKNSYSSSISYILDKYGKEKLRIKFNLLGKMYDGKDIKSIIPLKLTLGEFNILLYTVLSVCKDHHEVLESLVEASSNGEISENKLLSASNMLKEYHELVSAHS